MTEADDSRADKIQKAVTLHDEFLKAQPSQEMLEEVPLQVLPVDYHSVVRLRMTGKNLFIAFSDKTDDLEPNDDGLYPNVALKKISAMTGPRGLGSSIKEFVDKNRESDNK